MLKSLRDFLYKNRKNIILYGVLALVATGFVLLFSLSTSPVYKDYLSYGGVPDGGDSLHFMTDGKSWLQGRIPYRDNFDHKGPIIFLVNMLGFLITGGSRYGIVVFQIIALTITLIFVWKISQLAKKSKLWGGISVLVTLIFMTASYNSGNSVQEYNLPFILPGIYYLVRYFYATKQGEHNPKWAFVYGIGIGSCLLLQVTHAIPLCVGILVILAILIKQKLWQNLWRNLAYGVAGILVMWLPFALYFLVNGAFGDFIYCAIIFNFGYASGIGSWLSGATSAQVQTFLTVFVPFFCAGAAAILAFVRKKFSYAIMLAITFALEAYLFLIGQLYLQYPLPFIFQVGLLLNEIMLFKQKDEVHKLCFIGMVSLITILAYNQFRERSMSLMDQYNSVRASAVVPTDYSKLMDRHYNKIKDTSFTVYDGGLELKGFYVRYNLKPFNRFFVIQNWTARFSDKIKQETHEDLENKRAEYIMSTPYYLFDKEYGIRDVIDKYYKIIDREGDYVMYQLREVKND